MAYDPPQELLDILADPETHQPVRLATAAQLGELKEAVESGRARRHDGKQAGVGFEAAFLCQDGAVAYVVDDGIPIFLIDERLEVSPPLEIGPAEAVPESSQD